MVSRDGEVERITRDAEMAAQPTEYAVERRWAVSRWPVHPDHRPAVHTTLSGGLLPSLFASLQA